jgi:hypothetical protein
MFGRLAVSSFLFAGCTWGASERPNCMNGPGMAAQINKAVEYEQSNYDALPPATQPRIRDAGQALRPPPTRERPRD